MFLQDIPQSNTDGIWRSAYVITNHWIICYIKKGLSNPWPCGSHTSQNHVPNIKTTGTNRNEPSTGQGDEMVSKTFGNFI